MDDRPLSADERRRLGDGARALLAANRCTGVSDWEGRPYDFVCPSTSHYPFQWLWDSCFHAIALCALGQRDLAEQEIRCLLQGVHADGWLPHILFWEPNARVAATYNIRYGPSGFTTAHIQPPVLGLALDAVDRAGGGAFVREVWPTVLSVYRWVAANRDPDGDGLIAIIQPDESGTDASPKYDAAMGIGTRYPVTDPGLRLAMNRLFELYRPYGHDDRAILALPDGFICEDVLVNCLYAWSLRALAGLAPDPATAAELSAWADRVEAAIEAKCFDPATGAYFDLIGHDERPSRVQTVMCLLPLVLATIRPERAGGLIRLLTDPAKFWLPWPVPSVSADEPPFDPDYRTGMIWRGPTWINTNWMLWHGLRRHGRPDLAAVIARRSARLVLNGGFREFFNPFTGEPYGAVGFGWTTLAAAMLEDS